MGRQQQQRDRSSSSSGVDLLNFHFSSVPSTQQQQNPGGRRRNSQNQHNYNNHNYNNRRRNQQRSSAARRKPNSNMFNLHSSADHAFVIIRHGLKQQPYSFSGSDEPVSWESVRMVKYLVPSEQHCPICLDALVCARITKCGHFYCLSCLLRHVQSHAQSNPYTHVKCPCCSLPLHITDLRPVLLTTSRPPQLHQRIQLVKLHRTKDCPSPYLPRPQAPRRSSSHAAPCMNDDDAPYCRFNYLCGKTYQEHLAANKVELEMELATLTKYTTPQYRGGTSTQFHQQKYQADVEAIFVTSSLEVVQKEMQKALEEHQQEEELVETFVSVGSGVYQPQPPQLVASRYEFTKLPPDAEASEDRRGSVGSESEIRRESVGSESDLARRYRGDSISSYASVESGAAASAASSDQAQTLNSPGTKQHRAKRNNKGRKDFPQASMYLDSEGSCHFYQCQDGQLVFLSRFNMSCLMSDFSPKVPEMESISKLLNYWQQRKLLPLPDVVEGEILEVENVHLTPDMRKRMPFLAHLPLYTDIHFVELDLNNLLSMECKKKFKAELEKRRKRRQSKVKAEKREDKMAQKKEEERINDLKARMQQIDPSDEFFQVSLPEEPLDLTGEAFGPAISSSSRNNSASEQSPAVTAAVATSQPAFSFSNVCQSGGAFPALAVNAEQNFPALGSSPPSRPAAQPAPTWGGPSRTSNQLPQPNWGRPASGSSWGSPSRSNNLALTTPVASEGRPAEVSKQQPLPKSKKKSKGKKIVLFSSGGQRGTSY